MATIVKKRNFYCATFDFIKKFLSNGIHECVFIVDNVGLHKTNRAQIMLQQHGRMVIYLPPYSPFLNPMLKSVLFMEEHCRAASSRSETEEIYGVEDCSREITHSECDGYNRNMIK
ncbi:hypothetical protein RF11_12368 [Thelohanellus kitauei]|uniref:Tc1-like transposase DDE domain-containing protein n=1 Tax=Thelohanellus kitauei TaxID=669202 RepID=A0A0C2MZV5_THEKT|nr:hypothetical protein RF11_12368 [Thelohanellus kitauei]